MPPAQPTHYDIICFGLRITLDGIRAPLIGLWKKKWGPKWKDAVHRRFPSNEKEAHPSDADLQFLLKGIIYTWSDALSSDINRNITGLAREIKDIRNRNFHFRKFDRKRVEQSLEKMWDLLHQFKSARTHEQDIKEWLNWFRNPNVGHAPVAVDPTGLKSPSSTEAQQTAEEPSLLLDTALRAIRRGWRVFPLHPTTHQSLLDDPMAQISSHNGDQARQWWSEYPQAKIGLALARSGLIAFLAVGREGLDHLNLLNGQVANGSPTLEYRLVGHLENTIVRIYQLPWAQRANPPEGGFLVPGVSFRCRDDFVVLPASPSLS